MNKTPKEILLEQHHAVAPKLDHLCEDVLVTELGAGPFYLKLWNELIWPSRRAWAGLAAIWVVLAVMHLASGRNFPQQSYNPQIIAANWRAQQQLFVQLVSQLGSISARSPTPAAPPPAPDKSAGAFIGNNAVWA